MTTIPHQHTFEVGDAVWVNLGHERYPGTVGMVRAFSDGSTWLKVRWYDDLGFRTSVVEDRHCDVRDLG